MEHKIIEDYGEHILSEVESFIKETQTNIEKSKGTVTNEQLSILNQAQDLYLKKLETYSDLYEELEQEKNLQ